MRGKSAWLGTVAFLTVLVFLSIPLNCAIAAAIRTGVADSMAGTAGTGANGSGGYSDRFNMSYVYFGDSGAYTDLVDRTEGSLNDISPSYFDLNYDGSLKLTLAPDRKFINDMHSRGIKVTPFLSNHWDRQKGINALNNREKLSDQVAVAVLEYNLDGVNVDIENVTGQERDIYTDFVRLLRKKLPDGKSVSVAVAPNLYGNSSEWHASYDYAGLSQYSDYLMLMAYDEHYQGSAPGPVAGYPFVENCIKAALKEVPANKLVLGIPFYGRLWKQGSLYGGYGISNNAVEELISQYSGRVIYDYGQQSPKAIITVKASDKKPVVFGKTLNAGKYEIWYENEASIKKKLELVSRYGLKGTGSWSLGQETKGTWDYYSLWLNGIYFGDIQKHWAKESIAAVVKKGWMKGMTAASFMPEDPMTRAQAAVLLVRILNIEATASGMNEPIFADISDHWARAEIEAAWKNGLVKGTGAGKFEPDAELTREQMAVMLDRIINAGARQDNDAAQMEDAGTQPDNAGAQMNKAGLQPEETGSQLVDAGTQPEDTGAQQKNAGLWQALKFSDVSPETSPWSYDAISRMTGSGLLKGFPDGKFKPKDAISRGQMAVLIDRCF